MLVWVRFYIGQDANDISIIRVVQIKTTQDEWQWETTTKNN